MMAVSVTLAGNWRETAHLLSSAVIWIVPLHNYTSNTYSRDYIWPPLQFDAHPESPSTLSLQLLSSTTSFNNMAPRKISPAKATAARPKAEFLPNGEAVSDGDSSGIPKDILPSPGLKRKTVQVIESDDSDDDDDPFATPKPSQKKARRAFPGSPEFDELPPVSFNVPPSPRLPAVSQELSFGSADNTPFDLATPPASPVPTSAQKRIRKPSEKAKYMSSPEVAGTPANTPNKSKNSLIRVYPDGTELKYTPPRLRTRANLSPAKPLPSQASALSVVPEAAEAPSPEEYETNTHLTWKVRRTLPPTRANRDCDQIATSATASGSQQATRYAKRLDDMHNGYESDLDSARPLEVHKTQTHEKAISISQDSPVKERAQSPDTNDELSDYERTKLKGKGKGKQSTNPFLEEEADDSEHEATVPSSQPVMRIELQDILLRPYYHGLPELILCEIIPYPSAVEASSNKDGTMVLFSPLAEMLTHRAEKARFFRAVQFTSHNSFLNPARIAPSQVVKQISRCLTCASTRQTAIFVSAGAIAACNLITPIQAGSSQSPHTVKNVSIFPLTQEYERSISCLGMAFDVKEFYGPLVGGALTFSTRTLNFPNSTSTSAPTTPKAKGLFSTIDNSSRRNAPYPANFGVDDTSNCSSILRIFLLTYNFAVSIYDGRALDGPGFEFKGADFDRIRSLPLYRNGLADLPPYSVVAVGYTVNTFSYKGGNAGPGALALSLNVLFVILLGLPKKTD
ncbi:hypothetical protein BD779DRAFT_1680973 [Infundibulicybe gibba]|nr:hypothetical protein BD779DRAFT_1680973 [Infundibulicybe gibba]